MNKIFTLIIPIFFLSFISIAQISKGSILLGGDISAYTEKQINNNVEYKVSGVYFSPTVGKAIKDNLILGSFFSVAASDNDGVNLTVNSKEHIYGLGIFLRKYGAVSKNFYVFLQGSANGEYAKYEFGSDSYLKRKDLSMDVSPGVSYRISKKLHLESGFRDIFSIGYTNQKTKGISSGNLVESNSNRYYISSSISNFNSVFYFGFRLLIDKK